MAEHQQKMQEHMASMMKGDHAAMMRACQERMAMMQEVVRAVVNYDTTIAEDRDVVRRM